MTELLITPNYDRKTAKFKGNAAAGERISVTIENSSDIDTATLRLRVLSHDGRMLAVFAPNVEEGLEWSLAENGISCELSLDTVEMQKAVCGMCECTLPVVLDDPDNQKLWFKSECAFQGWPKLKGGESPYDLTGFPKLIDSWVRQLGNMVVSAKRVEGGVEILLWDGKGAKPKEVYVTDGEEGPKGDKGDIGIGISRIFFKQSDDAGGNVYEITLTDGSSYQFTAPRGPKGEQGDVSKAQLDAAIEAESRRAAIAEDGLGKDIATARSEFAVEDENINKRIDTLVGKDAGKTIREIADAVASALISGVVDGAPEALDTLKEIADWIRDDVSGAQAIVNQVRGLTENVATKADTTAVADLLNGKVDKDGDKVLSTNDYTTAEKDKLEKIEAGAQKNPDLSGYAKKTDIPQVPSLDGYAKKTELAAKRDKTDNIAAADLITEWQKNAGWVDPPDIRNVVLIPSGVNVWDLQWEQYEESVGDWIANVGNYIETTDIQTRIDVFAGCWFERAVAVKAGEPYVTPTGVRAIVSASGGSAVDAIPKYKFVDAAIADGKVTVAPYTNAKLVSDGTAFEVAVGGGSGYMRDCVLRVECGETVPTITWGANFHPRTDAETDFKCEAGKRNVYWITEYAPNEFVVAGWQDTEGGSAS